MKVLFIMVAIILSFRLVYHLMRVASADIKGEYGVNMFIAAIADAFLIIAFAILEKGRW